ncbi:MAG: 4-(cytidine 5'-diphospho)-2-C-methyl-D-erythritol kinase [Clostridia bacterium]|nr:4-(cytidine 5'-diphospho)-2-C-methyl-D-erythritol kinase [Clostridia bacterium]
MSGITLKTPAKLNLFLEITGRRADGYHSLSTVMQTVGIFDTLTVKKADGINLRCSDPELETADNLCVRAAKLFSETFGTRGAEIRLEKVIPTGAGLGGGSSDAAATLKAMRVLYGIDADDKALEKVAVMLGADVPFFIRGGTQYCAGIGEVLTPLPEYTDRFIVVTGRQKVSTPLAYRLADGIEYKKRHAGRLIASLYEKGDKPFFNRFEDFMSGDGRISVLKEHGAGNICLTGSGSAIFTRMKESVRGAFETLSALGYKVFLCSSVKSVDF